MIDHTAEVAIEAGNPGRCWSASSHHAEVIGGVRARRIGLDQLTACLKARPTGRKDRGSRRQDERILIMIAGCLNVPEGGPQRVHAIGQRQSVSKPGNQLESLSPGLSQARLPPLSFAALGKTTGPQERTDIFKRVAANQIFNERTAENELTALAVHVAQFGFRDDHAFQARHGEVQSSKFKVDRFRASYFTLNIEL